MKKISIIINCFILLLQLVSSNYIYALENDTETTENKESTNQPNENNSNYQFEDNQSSSYNVSSLESQNIDDKDEPLEKIGITDSNQKSGTEFVPTFSYSVLADNTVEITGCLNCEENYANGNFLTSLNIPSTIDSYTVTSIGVAAFHDKGIAGSLTLPETLTNIGPAAFSMNKFSGELILPNSLNNIGSAAFQVNEFSGKLVLPNNLTTISSSVFSNNKFSGDLLIPDSVITIGGHSFQLNEFNGHLVISNNLEVIGEDAFASNYFTGPLELPNGLTSIGPRAFYSNQFTGDLVIPDSVLTIGTHAFQTNQFNGNLTISNNLKVIEPYIFSRNQFTGNLILPENLTSIGQSAFTENQFTGTLLLPESIRVIGNSAFHDNSFTGTLLLPESIQEIGIGAFSNNLFTGDLIIPEGITTIMQATFHGNKFDGTLVLPESLIEVKTGAFYDNSFTGELIIPNNVTTIGKSAFSNNLFTGDLIIPENVKDIGIDAFDFNSDYYLNNSPNVYVYSKFVNFNVVEEELEVENKYTFSCGYNGSECDITIYGLKDSTAYFHSLIMGYNFINLEDVVNPDAPEFIVSIPWVTIDNKSFNLATQNFLVPENSKQEFDIVIDIYDNNLNDVEFKKIVLYQDSEHYVETTTNKFENIVFTEEFDVNKDIYMRVYNEEIEIDTELLKLRIIENDGFTNIEINDIDDLYKLSHINLDSAEDKKWQSILNSYSRDFVTSSPIKDYISSFLHTFEQGFSLKILNTYNIEEGMHKEVALEIINIADSIIDKESIINDITNDEAMKALNPLFENVNMNDPKSWEKFCIDNIALLNEAYNENSDVDTWITIGKNFNNALDHVVTTGDYIENTGKIFYSALLVKNVNKEVLEQTISLLRDHGFPNSDDIFEKIHQQTTSNSLLDINHTLDLLLTDVDLLIQIAAKNTPIGITGDIAALSSLFLKETLDLSSVNNTVRAQVSSSYYTIFESMSESIAAEIYAASINGDSNKVNQLRSSFEKSLALKAGAIVNYAQSLKSYVPSYLHYDINQIINYYSDEDFIDKYYSDVLSKEIEFNRFSDNLSFVIASGNVIILGENNTNTKTRGLVSNSIYIPETIMGYPVTYVANNAFKDNTTINSIYLPTSVEEIGDSAFENCINLNSAYFEEGLVDIGNYAFKNTGLYNVDLPNTIFTIGIEAFANNQNLETIIISPNLSMVGENAFDNLTSLEVLVYKGQLDILNTNSIGTTDLLNVSVVVEKDSPADKYFSEKGANVIQNISVESLDLIEYPNKTNYQLGENIDISGIKVLAINSDGTKSDVSNYLTVYSNTNQLGDQIVYVVYGGESASFTITVNNENNSLPSTSTIPIPSDEIDLTQESNITKSNQNTTSVPTETNKPEIIPTTPSSIHDDEEVKTEGNGEVDNESTGNNSGLIYMILLPAILLAITVLYRFKKKKK